MIKDDIDLAKYVIAYLQDEINRDECRWDKYNIRVLVNDAIEAYEGGAR